MLAGRDPCDPAVELAETAWEAPEIGASCAFFTHDSSVAEEP